MSTFSAHFTVSHEFKTKHSFYESEVLVTSLFFTALCRQVRREMKLYFSWPRQQNRKIMSFLLAVVLECMYDVQVYLIELSVSVLYM